LIFEKSTIEKIQIQEMNGYYLQIVENQLSTYLPDLAIRKIIVYLIRSKNQENIYLSFYNHLWNIGWEVSTMESAFNKIDRYICVFPSNTIPKHLKRGYKQMVMDEFNERNFLGTKENDYFGKQLPEEVFNKVYKYKIENHCEKNMNIFNRIVRCSILPDFDKTGLKHTTNKIWFEEYNIEKRIPNYYKKNFITMKDLYEQYSGKKNWYSRERLMEYCEQLGINAKNKKNFKRSKKNQYIEWIIEKNDWKLKDQNLVGWELDASYIRK
jgi:hypothetical protein